LIRSTLSAFVPLVLAFALRLYALGAPSLGYDEAFGLRLARGDLGGLVQTLLTREPYPPGFFLLLRGWAESAGTSEFALRYFSLGFSVLALALMYTLVRWLAGPTTALLAALLVGANPALEWVAQEARMYGLLQAAVLLAASLGVAYARRVGWLGDETQKRRSPGKLAPNRSSWALGLALGLATAATLYVHYVGAVFVLTLDLCLLGLWLAYRRVAAKKTVKGIRTGNQGHEQTEAGGGAVAPGSARAWLAGQALGLALYLPWLGAVAPFVRGYGSQAPGLGGVAFLRQAAGVWLAGYSDEVVEEWARTPWPLLILGGGLALAIAGLVGAGRRGGLLLALALLPVALLGALTFPRPVLAVRHTTAALPLVLAALACGLIRVGRLSGGRPLRAAAAAAVLSAGLATLPAYFADPAQARTDNRGAAARLLAGAGPNDLFVFDAPYAEVAVGYYLRGTHDRIGLPTVAPANAETTAATLGQAAATHDQLWLVLWQDYAVDPARQVEGWLRRHAAEESATRLNEIEVLRFRPDETVRPDWRPERAARASFGDALALVGYAAPEGGLVAGDEVSFRLYWRAARTAPGRYTVFTHLLDADGKRVAQLDHEPRAGRSPTLDWVAGEVVADPYRLRLPAEGAGRPPYRLLVGLYDTASGQRLPLVEADRAAEGDALVLTTFPRTAP
jgi:hypothetical protein